ncbi:hypothetical protein CTRI78_v007497 [Colletotrichum trifolii]|uniref:Protection of telomeres protein 1 n=1 Tax=Colletotrichum trifolii TaxID=5466 RepID=A0A4R8REC1_COLTR|nr:hypothetical protein CTRI78_v007497 [Colletotrichum trifolii]
MTEGTSMDLPKTFTPLSAFFDDGKIQLGMLLNVVGVILDCRLPMATRRKDWKAQMRLCDKSIDEHMWDVPVDIFRPQQDMPSFEAGDVVILQQAKVQRVKSDNLNLLTNWATSIHVYRATQLSKSLPPPVMQSSMDKSRRPTPKVEEYVLWLYQNIDERCIPEVEHFQIKANQSRNIGKDKYCELAKVSDNSFHNLVVEAVGGPCDLGDKLRLYVSDYTDNPAFYNYSWTGNSIDKTGDRDGDPFGYTSGKTGPKYKTSSDWTGPFGRKSMQITCYGPHATAIRKEAKKGTWLNLLNVQIKYGSNNANLEGFLRESRNGYGPKTCVHVLDPQDDPETIDPRLKDAIRRKRSYEKEQKAQLKQLTCVNTSEITGMKRPATEQPEKRLNSKQRRALQRAQAKDKAQAEEAAEVLPPLKTPLATNPRDLNLQVVCENQDQPIARVLDMLAHATHTIIKQGVPVVLKMPFENVLCRANVRVVDFRPHSLQDFASSRRKTEFDILSDVSSNSGSDSDEDVGRPDNSGRELTWEWCFALQLQDASVPSGKAKNSGGLNSSRIWVVVSNAHAQLLTGLDACNLRANRGELAKLREKLFILWGDLEEKKSNMTAANDKKRSRAEASKSKLSERPPLDSSDAEAEASTKQDVGDHAVSNRPFTCCIEQYGVQVSERDAAKADAGEGKRWERVFALFGTKISSF